MPESPPTGTCVLHWPLAGQEQICMSGTVKPVVRSSLLSLAVYYNVHPPSHSACMSSRAAKDAK